MSNYTTIESDDEVGTKLIFVGLDGEMTGTELSEDHKLCQIGIAFDAKRSFTSDVGWAAGMFSWEPAALEVNGFDISRITLGPAPYLVDGWITPWLEANGGLADKKILVPVGFNVGAFDMPFVKDALPNTYKYFSRRTGDLNAMCFQLDGKTYQGSKVSWKGWKRMSKAWANAELYRIGVEQNEHDAGYDARQAILCFEWLKRFVVS